MDAWQFWTSTFDERNPRSWPIGAVVFDPYEELLWTGSKEGRIVAYRPRNVYDDLYQSQCEPLSHYDCGPYVRWISTKAHVESVLHIDVSSDSITSLSHDTVCLQSRGAAEISRIQRSAQNTLFQNLTCMNAVPFGEDMLLGSGQQKLHVLNTRKGKVVKDVVMEHPISQIHRGHYVFCGSPRGSILLADPRSLCTMHVLEAHTGSLFGFDVAGNLLVTCGASLRSATIDHSLMTDTSSHAKRIPDPIIKVYDVRTLKALAPIALGPSGCSFLHFHPKLKSILMSVAREGAFQFHDVGIGSHRSPSKTTFYHVDLSVPSEQMAARGGLPPLPEGIAITAADISSSGDLVALADNLGRVHIYTANMKARINDGSQLTVDAHLDQIGRQKLHEPETPSYNWMEEVFTTGTNPSLSAVGLPYYHERLLSAWPQELSSIHPLQFLSSIVPIPIDPEILGHMKVKDFVGYAPNPRRQQSRASDALNVSTMIPVETMDKLMESGIKRVASRGKMVGSTKVERVSTKTTITAPPLPKPLALTNENVPNDSSVQMDRISAKTHHANKDSFLENAGWPSCYDRVEIRYTKFGVEDVDFSLYNRTSWTPLEGQHLSNGYCTALLQAFYFLPAMRNGMIGHMASAACAREACLSCELGFLFRMLDQARHGTVCRPSNFLQVLNGLPEIEALGLAETKDFQSMEGPGVRESTRKPSRVVSYANSIQSLNRFLLERLHKECSGTSFFTHLPTTSATLSMSSSTSIVNELFGWKSNNLTQCERCGHEAWRDQQLFSVELVYTHPLDTLSINSFQNVLEASFYRHAHLRGWCDQCRTYVPIEQKRKVCQLPNVLSIHANLPLGPKDSAMSLWKDRAMTSTDETISHTPSWLPRQMTLQSGEELVTYELVVFIMETHHDRRQPVPVYSGTSRGDPSVGQRLIPYPTMSMQSAFSRSGTKGGYAGTPTGPSVEHSHFAPSGGSGGMVSLVEQPYLLAQIKIPPEYHSRRQHEVALAKKAARDAAMFISSGIENIKGDTAISTMNTFSGTFETNDVNIVNNHEWFLFNDFIVAPLPDRFVGQTLSDHLVPAIILYSRIDVDQCIPHAQLPIHLHAKWLVIDNDNISKRKTMQEMDISNECSLTQDTCDALTQQQTSPNHRVIDKLVSESQPICSACLSWSLNTARRQTLQRDASLGEFTGKNKEEKDILAFCNNLDDSVVKNKGPLNLGEEYAREKNDRTMADTVLPVFAPLQLCDWPLPRGYLCGIDAEFVALQEEEMEIRTDGTKSLLRPKRFGLARVSVVRGNPAEPLFGVPFLDDYIAASQPVIDHLTEFSGIQPGDLDPAYSKYCLTSLKTTYRKLRLLVDMGCVFVGHGVDKDFRIINITVPSEQIIDTVNVYHLPDHRKLSLKFLAWLLLGLTIQQDAHCSVEDARTALLLYAHARYLQSLPGRFERVLSTIYALGRTTEFKPGTHDAWTVMSEAVRRSETDPLGDIAGMRKIIGTLKTMTGSSLSSSSIPHRDISTDSSSPVFCVQTISTSESNNLSECEIQGGTLVAKDHSYTSPE